jgi:hypothetical protein
MLQVNPDLIIRDAMFVEGLGVVLEARHEIEVVLLLAAVAQ